MSDHLISTRVLAGQCPRCRTLVLTGIAEGVPAHVDPHPVAPAGELTAVVQGRATYTVKQGELVRRDALRVRSLRGPVVVDHRCGEPIPAAQLAPPDPPPAPRQVPHISATATRVREHLLAAGPDLIWRIAVALTLPAEDVTTAVRRLDDAGQIQRTDPRPGMPTHWAAVPVEHVPPY
ncbi:hypothetical protein AB0M43_33565 [Longispora sp. NPDC051575]|uniref:hypothetical protein n=1 Tax=Longispora sp. NPDC051575 TaxID=3154943 RepID=UPI003433D67F